MPKFLLFSLFLCLFGCSPSEYETPAIRGVWITNVASQVLDSRENIEAAVERCSRMGFTDLYVVTWNNATTTFPSKTVEAVTGTPIQPEFAGRDPLAEIVEAGHAAGLRVHAWFEFGFAAAYRDTTGGPIIRARPHWAARDTAGAIATKNDFQWMNAFHPEVQGFVSDLVTEVVENYDVDGIQGDDRLPALPSLAGYSEYTKMLYAEEHAGRQPPVYYRDYDWVRWRSAKLSLFLTQLCTRVLAKKPGLIISMAPSIYPWSEAEYLQDWPAWLNNNLIDYAVPQVYRYDMEAYTRELRKLTTTQVVPERRDRLFPGVLLQVDDYNPSVGMLDSMIRANRAAGLSGEVYFFYEGLAKFEDYFAERYGR